MFELQTITGKNRNDVYLKRWRILGYLSPSDNYKGKPIKSVLPFTVRLHKFMRPDADDSVHNHPWKWAFSLVLWGGYEETRRYKDGYTVTLRHKAPAFNWISGDDYHKIEALDGNPITLFVTGPKRSSWGFLKDGVHVGWKKHLGLE